MAKKELVMLEDQAYRLLASRIFILENLTALRAPRIVLENAERQVRKSFEELTHPIDKAKLAKKKRNRVNTQNRGIYKDAELRKLPK